MFVYYFAYIYLTLCELMLHKVVAHVKVIDQGLYALEKGSVGIQFFIDVENDHHISTCKVNSRPKMCCLINEQSKDCSTDVINGDNIDFVKPKKRETLMFVYPTLYQYDQVGHCDFIIDFNCGTTKRSKQLDVNIPFNTQISQKRRPIYLKAYSDVKGNMCQSLDEDTLRDCEPVNCDLKYGGRRPFYESIRSQCETAPVCISDVTKKLPDIVYVPKSNICRDLDHPITLGDVYAISTGLGIVTESTKSNALDMKVLMKSNCSTISENVILLRDMMYGKLCPLFYGDTTEYKHCCTNAILSICGYIISICGLLLSIVCCIHTMVWCFKKWSRGELNFSFMNLNKRKQGKNKWRSPLHREDINREITDNLLRDVIVRDLPIEVRDSVVDICHRINEEIKRKKRYRVLDLGSQINLKKDDSDSGSEITSGTFEAEDERTKLMK